MLPIWGSRNKGYISIQECSVTFKSEESDTIRMFRWPLKVIMGVVGHMMCRGPKYEHLLLWSEGGGTTKVT